MNKGPGNQMTHENLAGPAKLPSQRHERLDSVYPGRQSNL